MARRAAADARDPILSGMLRRGQVVALCVLVLLTTGVVMVASADMSVRPIDPAGTLPDRPAPTLGSLFRGLVISQSSAYLLAAVGTMMVVAALPVRRLARAATAAGGGQTPGAFARQAAVLGACTLALLAMLALVYVPGLGKTVNGSARWVRVYVGNLSLQPSEFAKWGLVVVLAWYCTARSGHMRLFFTGLLPALAALAAVSGAVVIEDLGTGALIGAVGCLILLASGARVLHFAAFVPFGLAGLALALWESPYRLKRLAAFLDPHADPQGAGYHMIQALAAVASGQGFGRGFGHGIQKLGYLPEDRTDFLFAIICEELGVIGAWATIFVYVILLWTGLAIVRREREPLLKLTGLGVLLTLGMQALMNLMVVTGAGPTKGIALPLVSYGGTGWILTAASLGLLVAMDRAGAGEAADPAAATEPSSSAGAVAGAVPA